MKSFSNLSSLLCVCAPPVIVEDLLFFKMGFHLSIYSCLTPSFLDFAGGPVVKNLPANAGDTGLIPGLGRFHMQSS